MLLRIAIGLVRCWDENKALGFDAAWNVVFNGGWRQMQKKFEVSGADADLMIEMGRSHVEFSDDDWNYGGIWTYTEYEDKPGEPGAVVFGVSEATSRFVELFRDRPMEAAQHAYRRPRVSQDWAAPERWPRSAPP